MAVQTVNADALDPNLMTGPTRAMGGVVKTGTITTGTYYSENGVLQKARWLYVGATGDVVYEKWDGTTQTLVGLAAGVWHPICSMRVITAGTTATSLVWGS